MPHVYLKAFDQVRNKSRFYALYVVPDLWGGVSLVREYGRIGHPGTLRMNWHATHADAQKTLHQITHQKLNRGYCHAE